MPRASWVNQRCGTTPSNETGFIRIRRQTCVNSSSFAVSPELPHWWLARHARSSRATGTTCRGWRASQQRSGRKAPCGRCAARAVSCGAVPRADAARVRPARVCLANPRSCYDRRVAKRRFAHVRSQNRARRIGGLPSPDHASPRCEKSFRHWPRIASPTTLSNPKIPSVRTEWRSVITWL